MAENNLTLRGTVITRCRFELKVLDKGDRFPPSKRLETIRDPEKYPTLVFLAKRVNYNKDAPNLWKWVPQSTRSFKILQFHDDRTASAKYKAETEIMKAAVGSKVERYMIREANIEYSPFEIVDTQNTYRLVHYKPENTEERYYFSLNETQFKPFGDCFYLTHIYFTKDINYILDFPGYKKALASWINDVIKKQYGTLAEMETVFIAEKQINDKYNTVFNTPTCSRETSHLDMPSLEVHPSSPPKRALETTLEQPLPKKKAKTLLEREPEELQFALEMSPLRQAYHSPLECLEVLSPYPACFDEAEISESLDTLLANQDEPR